MMKAAREGSFLTSPHHITRQRTLQMRTRILQMMEADGGDPGLLSRSCCNTPYVLGGPCSDVSELSKEVLPSHPNSPRNEAEESVGRVETTNPPDTKPPDKEGN